MNDMELRIECLRLAGCDAAHNGDVVARAQLYYDFVNNTTGEPHLLQYGGRTESEWKAAQKVKKKRAGVHYQYP